MSKAGRQLILTSSANRPSVTPRFDVPHLKVYGSRYEFYKNTYWRIKNPEVHLKPVATYRNYQINLTIFKHSI